MSARNRNVLHYQSQSHMKSESHQNGNLHADLSDKPVDSISSTKTKEQAAFVFITVEIPKE